MVAGVAIGWAAWGPAAVCLAQAGYAVGLNSSVRGGQVPLEVSFTLILFTERGGRIASAQLDFGDGSPAARINYAPGQAPRPVRHTYRGPGRFDAVLTITTADGEKLTARRTIQVRPARAADPRELLSADRVTGLTPLRVAFAVGGTTLPFTARRAVLDTGDGRRVSNPLGLTVEHVYQRPGQYVARLRVEGDFANVARSQVTVRVLERPTLELSVRPRFGVAPLKVDVDAAVPEGAGEVELRLADKVLAQAPGKLSVILQEPGTHSFVLSIRTPTGERISDRADVQVTRHELSGLYNHHGGVVQIIERDGVFSGRFLVTTLEQSNRGYGVGEEVVRGQIVHQQRHAAPVGGGGAATRPDDAGLPLAGLVLPGTEQMSRGLYLVRHDKPDCPEQWAEYRFAVQFDDRPDAAHAAHRISGHALHAPWVQRYERAAGRLNMPIPRSGIVGRMQWVAQVIAMIQAAGDSGEPEDCVIDDVVSQVAPAEFVRIDPAEADRLVEEIGKQLDQVRRALLDIASGDARYAPSGSDTPFGNPAASREPVLLATGEYFLSEIDLAVPGRGLSWRFQRTYRSHSSQPSSLGFGWIHSDMHALVRDDGGKTFQFRSGRGTWIALEQTGPSLYASPSGVRLLAEGEHRTVRDVDGTLYHFEPMPRDLDRSRIAAVEDSAGNRLTYETDFLGRVRSVTDTLGRVARYRYGPNNLLAEVVAPDGRRVRMTHDPRGNLVGVDYLAPGGERPVRSYRYNYRNLPNQPSLDRNMVALWLPDEIDARQPSVEIRYGEQPDTVEFDRVVWQRDGRSVEQFAYSKVKADGVELSQTEVKAAGRATSVHRFDANGMEVYVAVGEPAATTDGAGADQASAKGLAIRRTFDPAGRLLSQTLPNGDRREVRRDAAGFPEQVRYLPRPGSDLPAIVYRLHYEPVFGRLKAVWGPFRNQAPTDPKALEAALLVRYDYDYEESGKAPTPKDETSRAQSGKSHPWAFGIEIPPTALGDVNGDRRTDQHAGRCVRVTGPAEVAADGAPRGLVHTLSIYDADGLLVRRLPADGPPVRVEYEPDGQGRPAYVSRVVRELSDGTERVERACEWDAMGNLIGLTNRHGGRVGIVRDGLGRPQWTVPDDPALPRVGRSYDAGGRLLSESLADERTYLSGGAGEVIVRYAYDSRGNRVGETRYPGGGPGGPATRPDADAASAPIAWTIQYDDYQRLAAMTDGRSTLRLERDPLGRPVRITQSDEMGRVLRELRMTHDPAGNLLSVAHTGGRTERYEYDGHNRLVRVSDGTRVLERTFDWRGNLVRQRMFGPDAGETDLPSPPGRGGGGEGPPSHSQPEGPGEGLPLVLLHEESWTVSPYGRQTSASIGEVRDGDSESRLLRRIGYDRFGRPELAEGPDGEKLAFEYADGALVGMTLAGRLKVRLHRDVQGRLAAVTAAPVGGPDGSDAPGSWQQLAYDGRGNLVETVEPGVGRTRREYDHAGRLVALLRFGPERRADQVDDDDGESAEQPIDQTRIERGRMGRPLRIVRTVRDGDAERVIQDDRYVWWGGGQLVEVHSFGRPAARFRYDASGQPAGREYFGLGASSTTYDPANRTVQTTDARGFVARARAVGDRGVEVRRFAPGSVAATPGGEQPLLTDRFEDDTRGRLVAYSRTTADGSALRTRLTYDPAGRSLTTTIDADGSAFTIGRTWTDRGRLASWTLPSGAAVRFAPDGADRLAVTLDRHRLTCRYDAGQLVAVAAGAVAVDYVHGRESGAAVRAGERELLGWTWLRGDGGLVSAVRSRPGNHTLSLTRDAAGRLTGGQALMPVADGTITPVEFGIEYDAAGNRVAETFAGARTRYVIDGDYQLARVGQDPCAYDAGGRLTELGGRRFAYNAAGLLVGVSDGDGRRIAYRRDAMGRVVRRTVGERTTRFVFDGELLLAEVENGRGAREYVYDPSGRLLAIAAGEELLTAMVGPDGSVLALIGPDGQVRERYCYGPFGRTAVVDGRGRAVPEPTSRLGFAGMMHDPGCGLYLTRSRSYLPAIGRFLEPEPLGPSAARHPYAYALDDPLTWRDPDGTKPKSIYDSVRDWANNPHDSRGLFEVVLWSLGLWESSTDALDAVSDAIERGEMDDERMDRITSAIEAAIPPKETAFTAEEIKDRLAGYLTEQMMWEVAGPVLGHVGLELLARGGRIGADALRRLARNLTGQAEQATGVSRWWREAEALSELDRLSAISGMEPLTGAGYRPVANSADQLVRDAARAARVEDISRYVDAVGWTRNPYPFHHVDPSGARTIYLPDSLANATRERQLLEAGHEFRHAQQFEQFQFGPRHRGNFGSAYTEWTESVGRQGMGYATREMDAESTALQRLNWYTADTVSPGLRQESRDYVRHWGQRYIDALNRGVD